MPRPIGTNQINTDALRVLREKSGLLQADLAAKARISPQFLNDLEAGRKKGLNPAVQQRLAEALNVPAHAFVNPPQPAGSVCVNGPALRELRERDGMSAAQLGLAAGYSGQFVRDLEQGRRRGVNPAIRKALAAALRVPMSAIETYLPGSDAA